MEGLYITLGRKREGHLGRFLYGVTDNRIKKGRFKILLVYKRSEWNLNNILLNYFQGKQRETGCIQKKTNIQMSLVQYQAHL